ncbi:MAG: DUF433 domain-containing protein [Verrucomicrobia bacterium]|nr:DUF433 domain-containing protein [Verrucomicrobiota bacterium]
MIRSRDTNTDDIRYQPLYNLSELAGYTRVNPNTLRTWALGRPRDGGGRYAPVIKVADRRRQDMFSFINLIEVHVLVALRKSHSVSLPKIRSAVRWLSREMNTKHPLAELRIETDGLDLFIRHFGKLVSASELGQVVIREVVEKFLRRVDRDEQGLPTFFYPFTHESLDSETPKEVVISPSVAFGRPVVRGTRIGTSMVFERYTAGESLPDIAEDYNLELQPVEEALRCEIERRAA